MAKRQFWPSLDGLRGLAILLVIAHNVELFEPTHPSILGKALVYVLNIGWVGVLLFFVLSGFLITGILIDSLREPNGIRNFLARRALRIFPLYYGLLIVFFVLLPLMGMQPPLAQADAPHQIWFWLYLGNWTPYGQSVPHTWSLQVEEQFYLIWPIVVYLARTPRRVAQASILVALTSIAFRYGMWQHHADPAIMYTWTPTRMDALALGGMAAAACRMEPHQWWRSTQSGRWILTGGVVVFLLGLVFTKEYQRVSENGQVWGYAALAIFFTTLVWRATQFDQSEPQESRPLWHRFLCWKPLMRIGQYSYAMYIFHKPLHDYGSEPVLKALHLQVSSSPLLSTFHVLLVMGISYGLAWVSWHTYEMQFLKLKRHFE